VDTISDPGNVTLTQVWNKYLSNPVVDVGPPPSWESRDVYSPTVIYDGVEYKIWYTGKGPAHKSRIGHATSPDGITWVKEPDLVLGWGRSNDWDDDDVCCPSVLYDGATYHMWYSGFHRDIGRIGYATSSDGIVWVKYDDTSTTSSPFAESDPVLNLGPSGSWDDYSVYHPSVIYNGTTFHMWYTGFSGTTRRIGYATSPDGITWTKYAGNPVLDRGPPGSWDVDGVSSPSVLHVGSTYRMWYGGIDNSDDERIGYATSQDGANWTKSMYNPLVDVGLSSTWDETWASYPTVIQDGMIYKMWYTGNNRDDKRRIGYAYMSYLSPGNITSTIFDSGANNTIWNSINWTEYLPAGTNITLATKTGNTSTPDASWSPWSAEVWNEVGSAIQSPIARYIQYRATLTTINRNVTPILSEVNINFTLVDITPPIIEAWEPGGSSGQNYTQGDVINVTWNASDNNPLPLNPINITYGNIVVGWNTLATNEENDGFYSWDTINVVCPDSYWINISVYDIGGQEVFDLGNFTFDILCPDMPPMIEVWEPGGTPGQIYTQGDIINVVWNASDDKPLPLNPINITYGNLTVGWTTIAFDEENDGLYLWDTSSIVCPGTYWMIVTVFDSVGQEVYALSNFSYYIKCYDAPPTIEAWEPGGTSGQTYTQGDIIAVSWNATDNKPLPANPINITYGNLTAGWITIATDEINDGSYLWDTSSVACPGNYWMNVTVYDSEGQETFDLSNFTFDVVCVDTPPTVEAWEPGGSSGQTYTQGDIIAITWNATDDKPLPANPINITYGNLTVGWTTIATDETNVGSFLWDTASVFCPGTYWMNISVYDSVGQETFDLGNFTFEVVCIDTPPTIEVWEPGGTSGQIYTQGDTITITWNTTDDKPLPANSINITYGNLSIGWIPIATNEVNDGSHLWDTAGVSCPGKYWMNISVYDSASQEIFDLSNFTFDVTCPDAPPTIEAWEPGGTAGQIYTQGDIITITWYATDDKPLPVNSINITTGGSMNGWLPLANDEVNDGTHLWDTSSMTCPDTYWLNISVYDSAGQEAYDFSNFTFNLICPDLPPSIDVWKPGGTSNQTYFQGELIDVIWIAGDDKPLPIDPINITYGNTTTGWTAIATYESNDGIYSWNTSGVPCPGKYWMSLSVFDSIGQIMFDVSNYSFTIECKMPPEIWDVRAYPNPQKIREKLKISAWVTDKDTDVEDLRVYIEISKPDGTTIGNFSMAYNTITNRFSLTSNFNIRGTYTFIIWAFDDDGNWDYEEGSFTIERKLEGFNWKPLIALIFTLILLFIGSTASLNQPLRFSGSLQKDRRLTFFLGTLPFVAAEILTGFASMIIDVLRVPPIIGFGLVIDLMILISGIFITVLFFIRGRNPEEFEKEGSPQTEDQSSETSEEPSEPVEQNEPTASEVTKEPPTEPSRP